MNILVVDDETILLESMKIGLEHTGYHVFSARNFKEALDKLNDAAIKIDLVATDYMMPGFTGIDLLAAIREHNPTLPVIMFTAYADKDMLIEAMKKSCNSLIEKPFTPNQLIAEIERIKNHCLLKPDFNQHHEVITQLAHQIRNPLFIIRGTAELIQMNCKNGGNIQDKIQRILSAVSQIKNIFKEVLL